MRKKEAFGVGSRLRELRERYLKLTQTQLADLLGVKQNTLSSWEREARDIPTWVYSFLASHFGVNINWLLTGEGEPFLTPSTEPVKKKDSYEGLSQEDRKLLELIKNLPPKDKDLVIQLLKRVAMATTSGSTSETSKNF